MPGPNAPHTLITDIGSTTTKALLLAHDQSGYTILAEASATTTVEKPEEDVKLGVARAARAVGERAGVAVLGNDGRPAVPYLTTSSAGGGLQILVFGLTSVDTGKAARLTAHAAGGVILHTVNGASSWESQPSGIGDTLFEIQFLDDRYGYAVGWHGEVRRTDDGGATWVRRRTPFSDPQSPAEVVELTGLSFISRDEGWVVGKERILMAVSGTLDWPHAERPQCLRFDLRGMPVAGGVTMTRQEGGWDVKLTLKDWRETAVIQAVAQ